MGKTNHTTRKSKTHVFNLCTKSFRRCIGNLSHFAISHCPSPWGAKIVGDRKYDWQNDTTLPGNLPILWERQLQKWRVRLPQYLLKVRGEKNLSFLFVSLVWVIKWWWVKLEDNFTRALSKFKFPEALILAKTQVKFSNFRSIPFDLLSISWVTNYAHNL